MYFSSSSMIDVMLEEVEAYLVPALQLLCLPLLLLWEVIRKTAFVLDLTITPPTYFNSVKLRTEIA